MYIVSYFGLINLWDRFIYYQHEAVGQPPMIEKVIVPGILFPLILGFICAVILKPKEVVNYWPLVVAPFFITAIRILLDDVSPDWLSQNVGWLIVGTSSTIFFSTLGAWIYTKFLLR